VVNIGDGDGVSVDVMANDFADLTQRLRVNVAEERQRFVGDIQRQLGLTGGAGLFFPSTLCTSSTIKPMHTLPRIIGIPIFETISSPSSVVGAQTTTRIMVSVSHTMPATIPARQRCFSGFCG
jgi:hypothetical protein